MADDRGSKIRKLKKLRDKAASAEAIGSEAEAQAFAEMVQKLLVEYKVDESELFPEEEDEQIVQSSPDWDKWGVKVRRREVPWMLDLGKVVAYGHWCRMASAPGTSYIMFIGKKVDADVAADVFGKLCSVAEDIADKEYVKYFYECRDAGNVAKARGFRQSFLVGFARRIGSRYFERLEQIREYYAHNQRALTVLNDARSKVDDWVESNVRKRETPTPKSKITNLTGYGRGRTKADEVQLSSSKEIK